MDKVKIVREKREEGEYYKLHYKDDVFILFKPEKGDIEMYSIADLLPLKILKEEAIYKEIKNEIKKFELRNIFSTKKDEPSLYNNYKIAKRHAEILEDLDKELHDFLNEELNIKKKRLKDLNSNEFSTDLYLRKYRDIISEDVFARLFNRYYTRKVRFYL